MTPELIPTDKGLVLKTEFGELWLDFIHDRKNYFRPLPKGKNELIARALGLAKGVRDVFDATAGLAQDAVVLARLGCRVRACERSSLIFPLLADARERASKSPEPQEWLERLEFIQGDSIHVLKSLSERERPQAIYLDPMFPASKESALPRKEMQIFRALLGSDGEQVESESSIQILLQVAREVARERVVVKRPRKAAELVAGVRHRFEGTSVRYDLYDVVS